MIRLNNDYNEIACSEVMAALQETTPCSYPGYGTDEWCQKAAQAILAQLGGKDAEVQFMIGGTQANATLIGAALRPWQSVISADCGHIFAHEAGSIEYTGHKILALPAQNAKLTAKAIAAEAEKYRQSGEADYLTEPKLVFLSSPSEYGTVYSKAELAEIRRVCDAYHLYLYLDGARLGYWLAMPGCDVTLADLAVLMSSMKAPIESVSAKIHSNGTATINLQLKTKSREQLDRMIKQLQKRTDIIEVFRIQQ